MRLLNRLSLASRRRRSGFEPVAGLAGAAAWWLRNLTAGADVSAVPDQIISNPAEQTQAARRATGNADFSLQFATNDVLVVPLVGDELGAGAINNGTKVWWVAFSVQHDGIGAAEAYFAITNLTGVASAMKIDFTRLTTGFLRVDLYTHTTNARRFTATTGQLLAGVKYYVTLEINCNQTGEVNQVVITVDGAVVSLTPSNVGTPNPISDGLATGVTGKMAIGNRRDSTAASPLTGKLARDMIGGCTAMAGVTQGCLTVQARANLRTFGGLP